MIKYADYCGKLREVYPIMTLTDLIVNFGDVIELRDLGLDVGRIRSAIDNHPEWKPYNPRKPIARYGLSVTSLDGNYGGVPDLDSLREYNSIHGTTYKEDSFTIRTPIVEEAGIGDFLDMWGIDLGRSHFLRLDAGGFFPPHRDNGLTLPPLTVRILVPINWSNRNALWIQDGTILNLQPGSAYFVNTTKEHSLFSFQDNTSLLVLNVESSQYTIRSIAANAKIL